MEATFTDEDAASMFAKLRAFAAELSDGERSALNLVGELAQAASEGREVEGFAIVPGGGGFGSSRGGAPGTGGSGGGSKGGGSSGGGDRGGPLDVTKSPAPPAPFIPIPYPNFGGGLASFPF